MLYSGVVKKPNTIESIQPFSGQFSFLTDLKLNAWAYVALAVWLISFSLRQHHPEWSRAPRTMLHLAPLLPGLLYLRSYWRFVCGMDELQQRMQLGSLLFAAMGTVLVGAVLSVLGQNEVPIGPWSRGLGLGGSYICLFLLWVAGSVFTNRRYR
jgi:hypothetical protein